MLTLKQCREKLPNNGKMFTDEQVLAIRDYFYQMARINIDYIKAKLKKDDQTGNSLHQSLHR
jgi:uncharacterized protein YpuA (DUF1002 family)